MRHLEHEQTIAIDADELFPTVSMIKVPMLGALFDRIERGELGYGDKLTYTKDRLYAGEDLLGSFKDGEKITLNKLAFLMITTSDKRASLWCQVLAGTGTAINTWLQDNGFSKTRVNSGTDDRGPDRKRYGWGQTTPREMAELLVRVRDRELVPSAASEEMARAMERIYWDDEALSPVPPDVAPMRKQGAVSASRMLWEHFEPGRPYVPPVGSETFRQQRVHLVGTLELGRVVRPCRREWGVAS